MPKIAPKYRSKQLTDDFINQVKNNGLVFDAFLTKIEAGKIIDKIIDGTFADPNDFLHHMIHEYFEYVKYQDLRDEVLNRQLQEVLNDKTNMVSSTKVFEELRKKLNNPKPIPAKWVKDPTVYDAMFAKDGYVYDETDKEYRLWDAPYKDITYNSVSIKNKPYEAANLETLREAKSKETTIIPMRLVAYLGNDIVSEYYFCIDYSDGDVRLLLPIDSNQNDIDNVYSYLGIKK